ncbi:MAG: carbon-nitrogen hydrolase family protein [Thermaerobacter sp.]|nr:carbon-nitrogen hydrolase family protein [Thermaerobacter sp.]
MPKTLRVAIAQIAPVLGDVAGNALRMIDTVRSLRGAHGPLDLVVFPELALTGYDGRSDFWSLSAQALAALPGLQQTAQDAKVHLAVGLPERHPKHGGVIYDSLLLIAPDGALRPMYRKVHLWQEEQLYFADGAEFRLAQIGGATVGLGICWDVAFPEWGRASALAGATVLLVASAWDEPSIGYWDTLLRARAIENGCWVIACNRAGSEGALNFGGHSQIVTPTGDVLAILDNSQEGTLFAQLDLDAVGSIRFSDLTGLRDRKPAVYAKTPAGP